MRVRVCERVFVWVMERQPHASACTCAILHQWEIRGKKKRRNKQEDLFFETCSKDTSARVCEFCDMFSGQRRQDCRGTKSTNLVHMWHKLNRFHINRGAMKVFWTRGPWQTIFGKHGTGSCRTDKKRSHSCATTMGTHVRMLQWIFEQQGPGTARYARTRTHRQWGRMHR